MQENHQNTPVGIDDMSAYLPQLYLPIADLAAKRGLDVNKLTKGLGLQAMAVADAREDTATLAANAVVDLIRKNDLDPRQIGRIYLGTETGLDSAKATASYLLNMLEQHFELEWGPNCFVHCDVVDMTFACVAAVDALQNTIDWVRAGENRMGIVVAADIAKYELGSDGEYTQGAGSVAMLVRENPRLLAIHPAWGVATRCVNDFFKPTRRVRKADLIREVLDLVGVQGVNVEEVLAQLDSTIEVRGTIDCNEHDLTLHKMTPVFDGQYSNECYQNRIYEAYQHYRQAAGMGKNEPLLVNWSRLVFHLPYAYQARRMAAELFMDDLKARGEWAGFIERNQLAQPCADDFTDREVYFRECNEFLRSLTKTEAYRQFVQEKIERGERASAEVGNLYTGSIFLALMSTLEGDLQEGTDLTGRTIGFFAYGSGSKSKVFSATVQPGWREVAGEFGLMQRLAQRQQIDYDTYEQLHRGKLTDNVASTAGAFFLADVCDEGQERIGARLYGYRALEVAVGLSTARL